MPRAKKSETPVLTKREQQVADGIVAGLSNKEIAEQLDIAYETVKEHVAHILEKYDVPRRELVAIRVLREQLTADVLGPEFAQAFDKQAAALERLAHDMLAQTAKLRAMVATAMRRKAGRKAKS